MLESKNKYVDRIGIVQFMPAIMALIVIGLVFVLSSNAFAMQKVSDKQLMKREGSSAFWTGTCTASGTDYCGRTPVVRSPGQQHPMCIGEDCGTGDSTLTGNDHLTYYSDIVYTHKSCPAYTNDPNISNCHRGTHVPVLARQIYVDALGYTPDGSPHTTCMKPNCYND